MISEQTIINLTPTLDTLNALKIRLAVKPGSVMEDLYSVNSAMINEPNIVDNLTTATVNLPKYIEGITSDIYDGPNVTRGPHSFKMEKYIEDISSLVIKHLNFAKSVVNPQVEELGQKILETMNSSGILSASGEIINNEGDADVDICIESTPSLLTNAEFLQSLEVYKDMKVSPQKVPDGVAFIPPEKVIDISLVGIQEVDKEIMAFMADECTKAYFPDYVKLFSSSASWFDLPNFITQRNTFEQLRFVLGAYLIANKLANADVPEGVSSSLPLQTYQRYISMMRDFLGFGLLNALIKVQKYETSDLIVIERVRSLDYKCIVVYGPRYEKWLADGGCPEALLGAYVTNSPLKRNDELLANIDKLVSGWKSYMAINAIRVENVKFDKFKAYTKGLFDATLEQLSDQEKELANNVKDGLLGFFKKVNALVAKEMMELSVADMKDPYGVALRLVAKCRYYYTSAWYILNEIKETLKSNEKMDVREAALIATINYLVEYVRDQIEVV